jgi:hypothetical protein
MQRPIAIDCGENPEPGEGADLKQHLDQSDYRTSQGADQIAASMQALLNGTLQCK